MKPGSLRQRFWFQQERVRAHNITQYLKELADYNYDNFT